MSEPPIIGPAEWFERYSKDESGEPIYHPFGGLIPSIVKGRATLLGGATASGKTALGLQWYREILDNERRGLYVTLEMTPEDLLRRFSSQFNSDDEMKEWLVEREAEVMIAVSVGEIEKAAHFKDYDLIVVDHAHELEYRDRLELGEKVKRIYRIAPSTNTAILLMAQMRRPDPAYPRPPSKHDFLEWGGFEQMASVALALYQPDEHSLDTEIYTLKNRFGPKPEELAVQLNPKTDCFERSW